MLGCLVVVSDIYPLISGPNAVCRHFVHAHLFVEAILMGKPYPIKALFCGGGNPIVAIQNSKRVWEAFKKLELLIVVDFFMTPTAELADYVLPAAMWLERDDVAAFKYENYIAVRKMVYDEVYYLKGGLAFLIKGDYSEGDVTLF